MKSLLAAAGDPHRACDSIIVAGTNGKGSTAATLASILGAGGIRAGLYTSPHLLRLNERWRVDGHDVSDDALDEAVRQLRRISARARIRPTYFEALTLLAFMIFRESGCALAVMEVGMGGRLDATNVVRPLLSMVTNVTLDHQEFLGESVRRIAGEKAGVIHRGARALTASDDPVVLEVIRRRCHAVGVARHLLHEEVEVSALRASRAGTSFRAVTPANRYRLHTPLPGAHQIDNVMMAVRGIELLAPRYAVPRSAIERGVAAVRWGGRAQSFDLENGTVIVDGAHNPAGTTLLAELARQMTAPPRVLVFAAMQDKDWRSMLAILAPMFQAVVCTLADEGRGESPRELALEAGRLGLRAFARRSPVAAVSRALELQRGATVIVAGSLYLAGAVIPWLRRRSRIQVTTAAARSNHDRTQANAIAPLLRPKTIVRR